MTTRASLVLDAALALLRPLVRLMLRHGVAYPAFAAALKRVFLEAAREELEGRGMARTDSAVSLLSGVHRRDVRNLSRPAEDAEAPRRASVGLAAQVVARWLSDPRFLDAQEHPLALPRAGEGQSFEQLVYGVSSDVRPRAVLDELLRLGIAEEDTEGGTVRLAEEGFAPRQGFEELSWQLRDNLQDHLSAATLNLDENRNFLEQAVFVDQISEASAKRLHRVAAQAWRQAFKTVMREAQARYDEDAKLPPERRRERARFGSYFFHTEHKNDDKS